MTEDAVIRRFERGDATDVSRLIIDNLSHVNVVDYGEAAVRQLALFYTPEWMLRYAETGQMYVAALHSEIIGTATLDLEHLRCLFVRIDYHRQGIGKLLMRHVEEEAIRQDVTRLDLLANVGAVNFYRNLGYARTGDREIQVGEARLTVAAMEKILV